MVAAFDVVFPVLLVFSHDGCSGGRVVGSVGPGHGVYLIALDASSYWGQRSRDKDFDADPTELVENQR